MPGVVYYIIRLDPSPLTIETMVASSRQVVVDRLSRRKRSKRKIRVFIVPARFIGHFRIDRDGSVKKLSVIK